MEYLMYEDFFWFRFTFEIHNLFNPFGPMSKTLGQTQIFVIFQCSFATLFTM